MPPEVAIDALLATARQGLDRVDAGQLAAEVAEGALVVDTRPVAQRDRDGELPGAVVVDRNVLEWRLDPTSPHRIPEITGPDQRIILVCNEGYSSSLAAATLRTLGLRRATDLLGGYQAWRCQDGRMADPVPAGSDVSSGTYQCTNCGYRLQVRSIKSLPPCPECSNGHFEALSGGDSVNDPYPDQT